MKTKPEIKVKLEDAEKHTMRKEEEAMSYLDGVKTALRWVLDLKTTQEPKDPVTGK